MKTETIKLPPNPAAIPAIPQRVALYEEDPSDQKGKRFVGSAIWRTEMVTPDLARRPTWRCAPTSKFRSDASP